MRKFLLVTILFGAGLVCAQAQDVIIKANGDRVMAKVAEIGDDVVKYKDYNNQNGPTYTIKTTDFEKITLESGDVIKGQGSVPKVVSVTSGSSTVSTGKKVNPDGYRNGFISATIGLSQFSKNYNDVSSGYEPEIMFSYLFSRIVGIAAGGWLNSFSVDDVDGSIGTYGFYVGPVFSIPTSAQRIVDIDIIPILGAAHLRASGDISVTYKKFHFMAGLAVQARWNFNEQWAAIMRTGYRGIGEMPEGGNDVSSSSFSIGIAMRF
ncbi:MAG: hypothetical protein LBD59_10675 [Prevotellaceae bacterium]|jgi:hypothetical protein|nr:hypothetical protein [Prevotellaceae bacterium]